MVRQSRQQALINHCPRIYTVAKLQHCIIQAILRQLTKTSKHFLRQPIFFRPWMPVCAWHCISCLPFRFEFQILAYLHLNNNLSISVRLSICSNFWPTFHQAISNISTDFDYPKYIPSSSQVRVVAHSLPQLTQASFLQKIKCCKIVFCKAEMAQSLSSLQKIKVFKVDYFDFSCKKLNNWCELDVRVISCNF